MLKRYKERLLEEWNRHGSTIIAVDFDDTISPWKFHDLEALALYRRVWKLLRECQITGAYIVCHTACNPDRYSEILQAFEDHGINDVTINKNPIDLPYGNSGSKVYANIFLDDRAGLLQALEILEDALYKRRAVIESNRLDYPGSIGF